MKIYKDKEEMPIIRMKTKAMATDMTMLMETKIRLESMDLMRMRSRSFLEMGLSFCRSEALIPQSKGTVALGL